jgi:hypothetical protein
MSTATIRKMGRRTFFGLGVSAIAASLYNNAQFLSLI